MSFYDGFVIPVPMTEKDRFIEHARTVDPAFLEHGALRVVECWGDDVKPGKLTDFQGAVAATAEESVAFSWIEWPDRETRDKGMAAIMDPAHYDPRADPVKNPPPFDGRRMIFGGFEALVTEGDFSSLPYVQGFIVPVLPGRRDDYAAMANAAWADMFRPYGALGVVEAWGTDVPHGKVTDFHRAVKASDGEDVVFSFMIWPSRQCCDDAQAKMMNDPAMTMPDDLPFGADRMVYGGFAPVLDMGGK